MFSTPFHETPLEELVRQQFDKWKKKNMCNKHLAANVPSMQSMTYTVGNTATPTCSPKCAPAVKKQEGNNPMRYEDINLTVAPSVAIASAPAEADAQRKHLKERLGSACRSFDYGEKNLEIRKLFNMSESGQPKTYKELIDAIKNGKFTLDEKRTKHIDKAMEAASDYDDEDFRDYGYGPFDGIIFTDFPKPDHDGYRAARKEVEKRYQDTLDTIVVADPKDGLAALKAFEAWMPTKATDTAQ